MVISTKARQQPQNIVEIQKNRIVSSLCKMGQYYKLPFYEPICPSVRQLVGWLVGR